MGDFKLLVGIILVILGIIIVVYSLLAPTKLLLEILIIAGVICCLLGFCLIHYYTKEALIDG